MFSSGTDRVQNLDSSGNGRGHMKLFRCKIRAKKIRPILRYPHLYLANSEETFERAVLKLSADPLHHTVMRKVLVDEFFRTKSAKRCEKHRGKSVQRVKISNLR